MKLTFLGTSSMVPTKQRNNPGVFLRYKAKGLLFDCGENIQRQLLLKGISVTKITKILISHWHGDHVLGLPGLLQTIGSQKENAAIEIYGPKGTEKNVREVLRLFPNRPEREVNIQVKDVKEGKFYEDDDILLHALPLKHGTPTLGYYFKEKDKRKINKKKVNKKGIPEGPLLGKLQNNKIIKWEGKKVRPEEVTTLKEGKKVAVIYDTLLTQNCYSLADNADVLVCESTYKSNLQEKATKRLHLTAKQAALIAKNSGVKKLILTHFSRRYKDSKELEKEAKKLFKNTEAAKDFSEFEL